MAAALARLTIFTSMKTTKAMMKKLMTAMMNLPMAKTGAPASVAAVSEAYSLPSSA